MLAGQEKLFLIFLDNALDQWGLSDDTIPFRSIFGMHSFEVFAFPCNSVLLPDFHLKYWRTVTIL